MFAYGLWLSPTVPMAPIGSLFRKAGTLSKHNSWNGLMKKKQGVSAEISGIHDEYTYQEINKAISAFYYHPEIDSVASRHIVRLSSSALLYQGTSSDKSHLMRNARFVQKELPVRVARRIMHFRQLPFIVGCNPTVLQVHEMYIRAFHVLNQFPTIQNSDHDQDFSIQLTKLLNDHRDVIGQLALGFKQCLTHVSDDFLISKFLDNTLTSRLGIRMLCEHHLALHNPEPNSIGIISVRMSLFKIVTDISDTARNICELHYGTSPEVNIGGNVNAMFPYIRSPLEYMLMELFKNAMRSVLDRHKGLSHLPPIDVTIASNTEDFTIKISDKGGGIPADSIERVFEYHFTSSDEIHKGEDDIMNDLVAGVNAGGHINEIAGYGFGLPTCRAYARYLKGDLTLQSIIGVGTDVYLRLRHIDGRKESFCI